MIDKTILHEYNAISAALDAFKEEKRKVHAHYLADISRLDAERQSAYVKYTAELERIKSVKQTVQSKYTSDMANVNAQIGNETARQRKLVATAAHNKRMEKIKETDPDLYASLNQAL